MNSHPEAAGKALLSGLAPKKRKAKSKAKAKAKAAAEDPSNAAPK